MRFLTQYVEEPQAINNQDLFYTFQGITDEGNAYVVLRYAGSIVKVPLESGATEEIVSGEVQPKVVAVDSSRAYWFGETGSVLKSGLILMVVAAGVEEFVADNVIILRNILEGEKRRRTIEILKFRGTMHQKGEYPFTIIPQQWLVGIPLRGKPQPTRSQNQNDRG